MGECESPSSGNTCPGHCSMCSFEADLFPVAVLRPACVWLRHQSDTQPIHGVMTSGRPYKEPPTPSPLCGWDTFLFLGAQSLEDAESSDGTLSTSGSCDSCVLKDSAQVAVARRRLTYCLKVTGVQPPSNWDDPSPTNWDDLSG